MQNHWTPFLTPLGFTLNADNHCSLDTQSPHRKQGNLAQTTLSPLTHYGILLNEGPDTAKFLQGQATCDTRELENNQARRGGFCNPKGRLFCSFLAANTEKQQTLLRMSLDITDNTQQILGKYLAFFKAEQRNDSQHYKVFGIKGPSAQKNILETFGQFANEKMATGPYRNSIAIQLDDKGTTFECWIHESDIDDLWPTLSQETQLTSSLDWELITIREGIADIKANTQDLFIPQMLNYQLIDAISFTKGCFTGQEIIARMQYKGKVKRQLYHIEFLDSASIKTGSELYLKNTSQSMGNIVSYAINDENNIEILAVLTHDAATASSLSLEPNNESQLLSVSLLSLPYNTETASK